MEFGEILATIAQELHISLTDIAEEMDIHRSKLYNLKGGRWNPNYDFCRKFLETYPQISADFLMTGKGSVLKQNQVTTNRSDQEIIIQALTKQIRELEAEKEGLVFK
ncbi:hypothetical protein ACS5NO_13865 [Larkinella sp. GY13]|uniref:hypothetical protein n=1 Tax=Larkinella sp. GY13 TaxID=3453720 RepID=UPI003EEF6282